MHWISLFCLASVSGAFLEYSNQSNKLTIRCPDDMSTLGGTVLGIQLVHLLDSGQRIEMLMWEPGKDLSQANKLGLRLKLRSTPDGSNQLTGEISNVACYDSGTYKCTVYAYNSSGKGNFQKIYEDRFDFPGIQPIITPPKKTCFQKGDVLQLVCSSLGSSLVWETAKAGEPFSMLVSSDDRAKDKDSDNNGNSDCATQTSLNLTGFVLHREDNERIFRCRVSGSDLLSTQVTVAVDCGQGCLTSSSGGSSGATIANNYVTPVGSKSISPAVETDDFSGVGKAAMSDESDATSLETQGRAGQVRVPEDAATGQQTGWSHTVMVTVVACGCVLIVMLLLAVLWRQKKLKRPQPLVLFDSTPPSEYSGYSARQLPNLPHLDQPKDHTTPKWIVDHQLDEGNGFKNHQKDANTSIYVSMDALNKDKSELMVFSHSLTTTTEPEAFEPDKSLDRSESVYSNSAAIDKEATSKARAALFTA